MTTAPTERIPVTVLTGFLGSGKTTTLDQLVRQRELAGALLQSLLAARASPSCYNIAQ